MPINSIQKSFSGILVLSILLTSNIFAQNFEKKGPDIFKKEATKLSDLEGSFIEGMKHYLINEYDKALNIFEKALEQSPKNSGILYQISATLQKLDKPEKAIEFARKAFDLDKTNSMYGQMLGGLLGKNGDFLESSKVYRQMFELDPSNTSVGLDLAATLMSLGKYDEVLKIYTQLQTNIGINEELTLQKQMVYVKLNKFNEAIKEGDLLIESDKNEIDYLMDQVEFLIKNDKVELAKPYLEKALILEPLNAQAHVLLADIYARKGDVVNCEKELEIAFKDPNLESGSKAKILSGFLELLPQLSKSKAILKLTENLLDANPKEPKVYLILADLQLQNGELSKARDNYLASARLDKSLSQLWLRVMSLDNDSKNYKNLDSDSEEAIEVFPNIAFFWYYNGLANYMTKNYQKAMESLEEAKRLAGSQKEIGIISNSLLAEVYNRLGKHEKSDQTYEKVLKDDPNNDGAANNYSYFLSLRKEKLDYAEELASKLCERNPTNGTFLDTYGWVLYMKKDYAKAKTILEKAYQNNVNKSAVVIEHYGDVLYQIGETEKAIEMWKSAFVLAPKNNNLEKKIAAGRLFE